MVWIFFGVYIINRTSHDGSLAVDNKEKSNVNLVNNFFSNIGEKLADSFQPQYLSHQATSTKIAPCVNNIALSPLAIERKLARLERRNFSSRVKKHFTRSLPSLARREISYLRAAM